MMCRFALMKCGYASTIDGAAVQSTSAALEIALMDHVERARLLRGVDDAGDVPLGRALGDRADVDVVPPERAEHPPGHVGLPSHPFADDCDQRLIGFLIERDQTMAELE